MSNVFHSKGKGHFPSEKEECMFRPWDRTQHDAFNHLNEAQCAGYSEHEQKAR